MKLLLLFSGALLLIAADVANAQRIGTRIGGKQAYIPDFTGTDATVARKVLSAYAECLVSTWRVRVNLYLDTFPGSNEARKAVSSLASSDCLANGNLTYSENLVRAHLYQILYRKQFRSRYPDDFSAVSAIDYATGADGDGAQNQIAIRVFADCVVRTNPEAARALTLSNTAMPEEKAAFDQLMPSLSGCLPADQQLEFSRTILKGLVAETLYRLSSATAEASAPGSVN